MISLKDAFLDDAKSKSALPKPLMITLIIVMIKIRTVMMLLRMPAVLFLDSSLMLSAPTTMKRIPIIVCKNFSFNLFKKKSSLKKEQIRMTICMLSIYFV